MIFGQFWAILLLGPSKSERSMWVKNWISFFSMGVTEEEKEEQQQQQEEEQQQLEDYIKAGVLI